MRLISFAIVLCLVVLSGVVLFGEEPKSRGALTSIEVGQNISETKDFLKTRDIAVSESGLALAQTDPDQAHLLCILDNQRAWAAIFYSKSTRRVTDISVIFFPEGRPSKSTQVSAPAKSIAIHADHSFAVEFPAPVTGKSKP